MLKVIVGGIIEPIIYHKRADKRLVELPGCNRNINDCIFINRMNIFPSVHRFTVTIMDITGAIDTGSIVALSVVTIYPTMDMTTSTISSTSTTSAVIGLLEFRTVTENIITTTFV